MSSIFKIAGLIGLSKSQVKNMLGSIVSDKISHEKAVWELRCIFIRCLTYNVTFNQISIHQLGARTHEIFNKL